MADIFLSYKRADRERVTPIVALLESSGWSVWWDTRIDAGETWDEVIERELGAASCVVVAWSAGSVGSRWVRSEASEGLDRGILVPVHIDASKPPLEFKLIQAIDLQEWRGDAYSPPAQELVAAVGKLLGRSPARSGSGPGRQASEEPFELPRPLAAEGAQREYWRSKDGDDPHARLRPWRSVALGIAAGLAVVVPAILWLSGLLGGPQPKSAARLQATDQPPVKIAEVKAVKVHVAPPTDAAQQTKPQPASVPPPVPAPAQRVGLRVEELFAQAKRRIESGDVLGAREILQAPETATSGALTFLLAETYDPNMLASWQTRGVTAHPERARALYQKARDLGENRAQLRLDWLKSN
jgi:hypothetical protein